MRRRVSSASLLVTSAILPGASSVPCAGANSNKAWKVNLNLHTSLARLPFRPSNDCWLTECCRDDDDNGVVLAAESVASRRVACARFAFLALGDGVPRMVAFCSAVGGSSVEARRTRRSVLGSCPRLPLSLYLLVP